MDRRRFLLTPLAGALATPLIAGAQQAGKAYRIGWLAAAHIPENQQALREGLHTLGYVEGNNIVIEERYAADKKDIDVAAAELVKRNPTIIVTDGTVPALAIKRTAVRIPVVFVSGDPVGMGLVPPQGSPPERVSSRPRL